MAETLTHLAHGATVEYPAGDPMFEAIENGLTYESHALPALLASLGPDDVFVDVGANVGFYAAPASKIVKRIIAVEPDETNVALLVKNLKANGAKNFAIYPVAASDHIHTEWFERTAESNRIMRQSDGGTCVPVLAIPLDILLKDENPTVIKLDCEGREPAVLSGSCEVIRRCKPSVSIEYSPVYYRNGCGDGYLSPPVLLFALGYHATILRWDGVAEPATSLETIDTTWREFMAKGLNHIDIVFHFEPASNRSIWAQVSTAAGWLMLRGGTPRRS